MLRRQHGWANWSDAGAVTASGAIRSKAAGVTSGAGAGVAKIRQRFSTERYVTPGASASTKQPHCPASRPQ